MSGLTGLPACPVCGKSPRWVSASRRGLFRSCGHNMVIQDPPTEPILGLSDEAAP